MEAKPAIRTVTIVAAAFFAIAIPILQQTHALGLSAAQFARAGDTTLRAAPYAFAIWGVIYLGLALYAIYQALPRTPETALLARLGWPSVIAMAGCGLWLIAAAQDVKWLTVAIIVVSAFALCEALLRAGAKPSLAERLLIQAPLALLAGWLTIASALNLLTVLTAMGFIGSDVAQAWALGGEVVVAAIAIIVFQGAKTGFYPLPIGWGFAGVAAAELGHRPIVGMFAAGFAIVMFLLSLVGWARHRG